MNFAKFLRTLFFTEHLRWLLLNLVIPHCEDPTVNTSDIVGPLLKVIAKHKNHPGIKLIKISFENASTLSFHYVSQSDIEKEIMNYNSPEASQDSNTPVEVINPF